MRILVLQHIAVEHPGVFREFLAADGVVWDAVQLDESCAIPALDSYDALWVMGGPMDVWEEDVHPWLVAEKAAIREAVVARGMPYLGFCLGHQLLAAALGGEVGKMKAPEVGILGVELTAEGRADPLFAGISPRHDALQWHGAEVTVVPPDGVVLASSPLCPVQAMRVGRHAYGIQYHVEPTDRTVGEWGQVPAYACALDAAMGAGALERLDAEVACRIPEFNAIARRLYDNWMRIVRG